MNASPAAAPPKPWPLFRSFAGWRWRDLGSDAAAGLTLAAIAIPEQMATARLAGFPPQVGFIALVVGAVGFAAFGASRLMSIGANSTVAPIFAGALALLATAGSPHYAADAAALALGVGVALALGGALGLGFVADLLSIPVATGFLAGIAGHIVVSQAPALLGVAQPAGPLVVQVAALAGALGQTGLPTLCLGLFVLAAMLVGERLSPRFPGALIGLALATVAVAAFGLERRGVATLGAIEGMTLHVGWPQVALADLPQIAPLAIIVALVVMVQTAATTRSFVSDLADGPDVGRDSSASAPPTCSPAFSARFRSTPARRAPRSSLRPAAFRSSARWFAPVLRLRWRPWAAVCSPMCRMRRLPAFCCSSPSAFSASRRCSTSGGAAARSSRSSSPRCSRCLPCRLSRE